MSTIAQPLRGERSAPAAGLVRWWPLAAITLLAAALRLSTLNLQSFWYDEAFTPVHVLHASLFATFRAVAHTENSPPLWYLIEWIDYRVLGDGEVALRLPSALAGIALVPLAWGIGRELGSRIVAISCAALVAVNPLFVWYSQEARVYSLFALASALAILCFLRALARPDRRRMTQFALTGAIALATHYFAVFLLAGMAAWLLWEPRTRRACLGALAAIGVVGLALLPLLSAQGGHGTQWIGQWALSSRLQAIPQYYLTGYSGAPLGHGIELLVALPLLGAVGMGLWSTLDAPRAVRESAAEHHWRRKATLAFSLAAAGILIPLVLALLGADYLAPRNLLAAMIPVTALIALLGCWPRAGRVGIALLVTGAIAFLAISIDVDLSPRLQRGNWRQLARDLPAGRSRAITTVELGSAPLEYYIPRLYAVAAGGEVRVSEIVETGYAPLAPSAGQPPAAGFLPVAKLDVDGLIAYRFVAPRALLVSAAELRDHVITLAHPDVLVERPGSPGDARVAR
jgi:mannosyltransferase